jgi:uncharacterized membrane protein YdjX (TVP38/TMEM64 family)
LRPAYRLIAVILFAAVLWAVLTLSGLREHFNLAYLQQQINDNRVTGLLVFVLLFVLANLIQIPGWIFLVAAILAMGRAWGGGGAHIPPPSSFPLVSCVVTFVCIRFVGGDALRQFKNRFAARMLIDLDARPVRNVFLLRAFFQTLPALNYALALSGIRFRPYLAGTLLGLPLPILVFCLFFDYLVSALNML